MVYFVVVSLLVIAVFGAILFGYKRLKIKVVSEAHEFANLKKWSSVGQMAGGIAHEVNTPLTVMILGLEGLLAKVENNKPEELKKDVEKLIRTGERIGNIVHSLRLLTLTGGGTFERDKVSLFKILVEAKNEYTDKMKAKNIDFAYMYNVESDGLVWGSGAALKHVVSNILKNAVEAVEELDEKWVKLLLVENKHQYKILIQNSGPHIDKAVIDKIFDPFFSTKDVGTAMGIGLSVSKTLVLAHGGTIRVDTKNPHVMFEIALPKIKVEKKKDKLAA